MGPTRRPVSVVSVTFTPYSRHIHAIFTHRLVLSSSHPLILSHPILSPSHPLILFPIIGECFRANEKAKEEAAKRKLQEERDGTKLPPTGRRGRGARGGGGGGGRGGEESFAVTGETIWPIQSPADIARLVVGWGVGEYTG